MEIWHKGDEKPSNPGVYLARYSTLARREQIGYAMWNGQKWSFLTATKSPIFNFGADRSEPIQDKEWATVINNLPDMATYALEKESESSNPSN